MAKKLQYLNNKGLISLCKNGETEDIKAYIDMYSNKLVETEEELVQVKEVVEILGIDKGVEKIRRFLGNKHILPKTLIKLCHQLDVENDDRLQYEELLKLENEVNWYEYVIEELQKSLGE